MESIMIGEVDAAVDAAELIGKIERVIKNRKKQYFSIGLSSKCNF